MSFRLAQFVPTGKLIEAMEGAARRGRTIEVAGQRSSLACRPLPGSGRTCYVHRGST
jgi:hypothetical protein